MQNGNLPAKSGRIEYIDAMRGFTMLLVVYCHVTCMTFQDGQLVMDFPQRWIFNNLFVQFRMPLFFLVSGFVMYKASRMWNFRETLEFFKKKIPVQLIFPFICMCIYLGISHVDTVQGALLFSIKSGYWFTWVLLEFYVLYVALQQLHLKGLLGDAIQVAVGVAMYFYLQNQAIVDPDFAHCRGGLAGALSLPMWKYFMFFIFGTQIRKHFQQFEQWLDTNVLIILCLATFISTNIFDMPQLLTGALSSMSGVILILAFFRRYQDNFTHEKRVGRILQFVGRRTLDVYLLHYWFIVGNDATYRQYINGNPLIELICSLAISALIICLSLTVSAFLRLSPFIAHHFFGAKK